MKHVILFSCFFLLPSFVFAATPNTQSLISVFMSLVLVIVIIVILAMLVKRFNPQMTATDEFKMVRSIPIGAKERLIVIEIDNKHHLLGVTPQAINYLYQLEQPLAEKEMPPLAKSLNQLLNPKIKND